MKTTFVLKRWLRRKLVSSFNLNRPFNYPYISGDAFRALAQHVYDNNSDIVPEKISTNDIVFVGAEFIHVFFKTKHPYIENKYILITHNGDVTITKDFSKYVDDKIIHWFADNLLEINKKMSPIPIGLMNMFCNHIGKIEDLTSVKGKENKIPGITYGYSLESGGEERITLHSMLTQMPLAHSIFGYNHKKYFRGMSEYMYTVSPEGNVPDCHRTWEALYLGVIPIVKRNAFIDYFANAGLPFYIIENWSEIKTLDKEHLSIAYYDLMKNIRLDSLYMDYWIREIENKKIKNNDYSE